LDFRKSDRTCWIFAKVVGLIICLSDWTWIVTRVKGLIVCLSDWTWIFARVMGLIICLSDWTWIVARVKGLISFSCKSSNIIQRHIVNGARLSAAQAKLHTLDSLRELNEAIFEDVRGDT